jgi:SNF2 family DNA or RNA helicase
MNVRHTINKVNDLLNEFVNKKIVVFTDHLDTADELSKAFNCQKITGQVPMNKRNDIIEDFKNNSPVLVCTVGAAGVGLNLQFANIMIFNDLPWVPGDLAQAEKRIHRIGQTDKCYYFYVLDTGLGALIYKVLVSKIQTLKEIA